MNENITFTTLGISGQLTEKLSAAGIVTPTAVQAKVIPSIMKGNNVVFQSETGTGKTFAYLLPLVQKTEGIENIRKSPLIMIVSPTFELASQLKEAAHSITEMKANLFIGGAPIKRQIEYLKEKPEIIIGNPARLLELIRLKKLKVNELKAVILDEADRLVTKEIRDETEELLGCIPASAQHIACSATMSETTCRIINDKSGETEKILLPPEDVLRLKITHMALFSEQRDKIDTLRSLLYALSPEKALVFTSRADQVENIASKLRFRKIECEMLHAKTKNQDRKTAIDRFKSGKCRLLITSDLASRGLDIQDITHVIQMDLPSDNDFFIHRSGRTARAGKTGINIVIGDGYEMRKFAALEKKLKIKVYPKVLYKGKLATPEENMEPKEEKARRKEF